MADSDAGGLIDLRRAFLRGLVIPAHPLALTADRRLDERRQVALTRYYCDAGAGGLAVAVHTTQFEIRKPEVGLLEPVLELAMRTVRDWCAKRDRKPVTVADIIPLVGFYLQPAVGGRVLDADFWRGFLAIDGVVAIKVAPFDRYRTLDVVRALADTRRTDVALY